MPMGEVYRRQAALVVKAIPFVGEEICFALKGGTAINLFLRDMPRLSVDIGLTYLPVADRGTSLKEIDAAMRRIAQRISRGIAGARVAPVKLKSENCVSKLFVQADGVQIKIEVTPVLRGCVYEPGVRSVSPRVEEELGYAEMQVLSAADLYAGKIMAALDRQHPRDLFDARDLLANEGVSDDLRKSFVVYLVSHDGSMSEVLAPTRRDISEEFARGFDGMTDQPVTLEELVRTREDLIGEIVGNMPGEHRRFLVSVKEGEPDWNLLGLRGVEALPAVRWKLQNLAHLETEKRGALIARLRDVLGVAG